MEYFGRVHGKAVPAFAMLLTTGMILVGSVIEFVSCVVLPLRVVTVALLLTWVAPVSLISTDCGIDEALTNLRIR